MAQKDIGLLDTLIDEVSKIKLDFDAFPIEADSIPAMSLHLKSLFKTLPINITDLAQLLAQQNYIGSVLKIADEKVSGTDGDDEEDEFQDDGEKRDEFVMALTSVVNLTTTRRKKIASVVQVSELVELNCEIEDRVKITELLAPNAADHVGLIINERMNGLPPEIGQKMLSSLISEMKVAFNRGMPYKFDHYLIPIRCYQLDQAENNGDFQYFNEDDGDLVKSAVHTIDVKLGDTVGEVYIPTASGDGCKMGTPFVRFLIIKAEKLHDALGLKWADL